MTLARRAAFPTLTYFASLLRSVALATPPLPSYSRSHCHSCSRSGSHSRPRSGSRSRPRSGPLAPSLFS
eukprot:1221686-Pleurochrysis_carterae.AAC.1